MCGLVSLFCLHYLNRFLVKDLCVAFMCMFVFMSVVRIQMHMLVFAYICIHAIKKHALAISCQRGKMEREGRETKRKEEMEKWAEGLCSWGQACLLSMKQPIISTIAHTPSHMHMLVKGYIYCLTHMHAILFTT